MTDMFLVRLLDGPFKGLTSYVTDFEWPLPERIEVKRLDETHLAVRERPPLATGGHYRKVSESPLPTNHENYVRGAAYAWLSDG